MCGFRGVGRAELLLWLHLWWVAHGSHRTSCYFDPVEHPDQIWSVGRPNALTTPGAPCPCMRPLCSPSVRWVGVVSFTDITVPVTCLSLRTTSRCPCHLSITSHYLIHGVAPTRTHGQTDPEHRLTINPNINCLSLCEPLNSVLRLEGCVNTWVAELTTSYT